MGFVKGGRDDDLEAARFVGRAIPGSRIIYGIRRFSVPSPIAEQAAEMAAERAAAERGPVTNIVPPSRQARREGEDYDTDGIGMRVWRWLSRAWR